jgi:tetratricopeptide (TPR) repeat protein
MELDASTNAQDLVPTDDVELAKKQVEAYPDSPEASFILAVALTRTSRVEEALKEVRRARKLAEQKGGTDYFDKMIATYEELLKNYPNENRVRYGLAWAYYMKAYLVANYSRKVAAWKAKNGDPAAVLAASGNDPAKAIAKAKADLAAQQAAQAQTNGSASSTSTTGGADAKTIDAAKAALQSATKPGKPVDVNNILAAAGALAQGNTASLPKIPSVMDNVDPSDVPKIKQYYELALSKLDDLLAQKPDDVWALVYRAHLKAEYTGNIDDAMKTWKACSEKFPNNPAAYFFLGEGFLKQGNLKESLNNVSKAVALRAVGN